METTTGTDTGTCLQSTYSRLCAVTKAKKKYGPARQGAKKTKALERLQSVGPQP